MLTDAQIDELSRLLKIDRFSVFREYLQLVFLSELYQLAESVEVFFKGGTAIHLVLHSPRFSEDLDFSTPLAKKEIVPVVSKTVEKIRIQIPQMKVEKLYETEKSVRFKLKYQTDLFKYPLSVKIDFQAKEKPALIEKTPLITQFPMQFFPIVSRLGNEEILAEKTAALLTRFKGRDFFDLWFLLTKNIKINERLIKKKLGGKGKKFSWAGLSAKIKKMPEKTIEKDLNRFLPAYQRKIVPLLKPELLKIVEEKMR